MKKITITLFMLAAAVSVMAAMSDSVSVGVSVGEGSGSFLTVEPAVIDFGTVNASPSEHRFASNILTCEFYAATAPWSIEVSADNPEMLGGLVAERDGINYSIPMKFWTSNYGGTGDPNDDDEWTGPASVFRWVLDNDEAVLFKLSAWDEFSSSTMPFLFAIDVEGALRTNYSTTVTLDLVVE